MRHFQQKLDGTGTAKVLFFSGKLRVIKESMTMLVTTELAILSLFFLYDGVLVRNLHLQAK